MATDLINQYRDKTRESSNDLLDFYGKIKTGFKEGDPTGTFETNYGRKLQEGFASGGDKSTLEGLMNARSGTEMDTVQIRDSLRRSKTSQLFMEGAKKVISEKEGVFQADQSANNFRANAETSYWQTDQQESRAAQNHASAIAAREAAARAQMVQARAQAAAVEQANRESRERIAASQLDAIRKDKMLELDTERVDNSLDSLEYQKEFKRLEALRMNKVSEFTLMVGDKEKGAEYLGGVVNNEIAENQRILNDESSTQVEKDLSKKALENMQMVIANDFADTKRGFFGGDKKVIAEGMKQYKGVPKSFIEEALRRFDESDAAQAENLSDARFMNELKGESGFIDTIFGKTSKSNMKEDHVAMLPSAKVFNSVLDSKNKILGEAEKMVSEGWEKGLYKQEQLPQDELEKIENTVFSNIGYDERATIAGRQKVDNEIYSKIRGANGGEVSTDGIADSTVLQAIKVYNEELDSKKKSEFKIRIDKGAQLSTVMAQIDAIDAISRNDRSSNPDANELIDSFNGIVNPSVIFELESTIDGLPESQFPVDKKAIMKATAASTAPTFGGSLGYGPAGLMDDYSLNAISKDLNISKSDVSRLLSMPMVNISNEDQMMQKRISDRHYSEDISLFKWGADDKHDGWINRNLDPSGPTKDKDSIDSNLLFSGQTSASNFK